MGEGWGRGGGEGRGRGEGERGVGGEGEGEVIHTDHEVRAHLQGQDSCVNCILQLKILIVPARNG